MAQVPLAAEQEKCNICGEPAYTKVEEVIFDDDAAYGMRHPFTAYICREHFRMIMGPAVDDERWSYTRLSDVTTEDSIKNALDIVAKRQKDFRALRQIGKVTHLKNEELRVRVPQRAPYYTQ